MSRLDWEGAARRDASRPERPSGGTSVGRGKTPTDAQLRYIAALAQEAGETLAPPTTRAHASREIERLRRKVGKT